MSGALLAVTLVAIGIVGANILFGSDPAPEGEQAGPAVTSPASRSGSPSPPAASRSPSATPDASAEPSVAPTPSAPGSPTPSSDPALREPLTVLNASRRTGLAARAAQQFRDAGWTIAQVGNYRARVIETTVYFPPGHEAAARQLQAEFPAVGRRLPRPPELPGSGLTVVVTREYPA